MYQYPNRSTWAQEVETKTVVREFEYDSKGNLVKETVTTTTVKRPVQNYSVTYNSLGLRVAD